MRKVKIFIIAIIVIVLIIFVGSYFYPPVDNEKTSGTIAKEKVTRNNTQLKKVLLKDKAELVKMIHGLEYFNNYILDLTLYFDTCINNLSKISYSDDCENKLSDLKDFNQFIKDNRIAVDNTISILNTLYNDDAFDENTDIEGTLKKLDEFVFQLTIRDTVVNKFISKAYEYGTLKSREDEVSNLMSIVDEMAIKDMEWALVKGDEDKIKNIKAESDSIIACKAKFENALDQEKLSVYDQIKKDIFRYDKGKLGLLPLFNIENIFIVEKELPHQLNEVAENIN